jgi:hypothetical protein
MRQAFIAAGQYHRIGISQLAMNFVGRKRTAKMHTIRHIYLFGKLLKSRSLWTIADDEQSDTLDSCDCLDQSIDMFVVD